MKNATLATPVTASGRTAMVWYGRLVLQFAPLVLLSACATPPRAPASAPVARTDVHALRERAARLWAARVAERWSEAYDAEDPAERGQVTLADYERWNRDSQPFVYRSFKLGRVEADGDLGWVEVECATTMRKFPDVPPREAVRWEKWQAIDGQWYLASTRVYDQLPDPPCTRDRDGELRLRARFDQTWRARQARDWVALHAFIEPRSQTTWPVEELARAEGLSDWRSHQVIWVEAKGDVGRVRVRYETKRLDPSLSKMPPEKQDLIERWVRVDGEWYRAVAGAPPSGS